MQKKGSTEKKKHKKMRLCWPKPRVEEPIRHLCFTQREFERDVVLDDTLYKNYEFKLVYLHLPDMFNGEREETPLVYVAQDSTHTYLVTHEPSHSFEFELIFGLGTSGFVKNRMIRLTHECVRLFA